MRDYTYIRQARGGCHECHGDDVNWSGPNAQGVAARHHDTHGHGTWCEIVLLVFYGDPPPPFASTQQENDEETSEGLARSLLVK